MIFKPTKINLNCFFLKKIKYIKYGALKESIKSVWVAPTNPRNIGGKKVPNRPKTEERK